MRSGFNLGQRRRLELVASIVVVMVIGVTLLADTGEVGFGQSEDSRTTTVSPATSHGPTSSVNGASRGGNSK